MSAAPHRERRRLVRLLQMAYSAEKAAAYAYQGHAASVGDEEERQTIRRIEAEEWVHRENVGRMLTALGKRPVALREALLGAIGRVLSALCPWSGWLLPMFFAWKLETMNVDEYETAARHARALSLPDMETELRTMAAKEREHEVFFAGVVRNRRSRRTAKVAEVPKPPEAPRAVN